MNKIPRDFDYKIYSKLNPDLPLYWNEEQFKNHYLEKGIMYEREYKVNLPHMFNWKTYLSLNPDLSQTADFKEVIYHYLNFGFFENRLFK